MKKKTTKGTAVPDRKTVLKSGDFYYRKGWIGPDEYEAYGYVTGPCADQDTPGWARSGYVSVVEWSPQLGDDFYSDHPVECFERIISKKQFERAVGRKAAALEGEEIGGPA